MKSEVKYVPSWVPGAAFQKRIAWKKGIVIRANDMPYDRAQAERVSASLLFLLRDDRHWKQRSGAAKQSFLGKLLDEHDPTATDSVEHERDLKLVGANMMQGECHRPEHQ